MGILLHGPAQGFGAALALMVLAQGANAQSAGSDNAVQLPPIVVSPTSVPTPANKIASSVTVITAEDIARTQRRTVADVLTSVPGLNVVQNGTPGTQTSVFIRGTSSNHVKVLIDGVDVSDSSTPNGAIDFGHLMTSDIDRIEVLRGPQSGLYGADAIGGVISITTKKGSGPAKATGFVEGGSFGTFNQAAGVNGSADRFNYAFNVSHNRYTNMPVTPAYMVPAGANPIGNAYDNKTLSTRLGADLNQYLTFNLFGRYTDAKLNYTNDDPNSFPSTSFAGQSVYTNKDFHGRAESIVTLLDGRFVNTFGANYTDFNRDNRDPDGSVPNFYRGKRDKYDWRGNFALTPGQMLVAGLERENDRANTTNLSASTGNQAGFLELQSEFAKRFFVVSNIRRDRHDAFGGHTTWRVAPAFIVPVTETKLKGSYGTGFKAPELYQLYGSGPFGYVGNPQLTPETSRGFDFGFEQPLKDDRVRFGVTYYRNNITNIMANVFTPVNTYVNVDRAVTYGEEAFVAVKVNERLRARLDYTRTSVSSTATTPTLRRPKNKYALSVTWEPIDRWTLSPTVVYLGRWLDVDRVSGAARVGGEVTLVNLATEYAIDKNWNVFARADNLFNRRYENPIGWQQPGFGLFGGVRVTTN